MLKDIEGVPCLCKWTVMSPLEHTAYNSHCYLKINIASHQVVLKSVSEIPKGREKVMEENLGR